MSSNLIAGLKRKLLGEALQLLNETLSFVFCNLAKREQLVVRANYFQDRSCNVEDIIVTVELRTN